MTVLPNLLTTLKIIRAHIEGEGNMAKTVDDEFVLVGYEYEDGNCTPITPTGRLTLRPGYVYALLNTVDKSYTDIETGQVYREYKQWIAPLWSEFDQANPPEPPARPPPSAKAKSSDLIGDPKAWR